MRATRVNHAVTATRVTQCAMARAQPAQSRQVAVRGNEAARPLPTQPRGATQHTYRARASYHQLVVPAACDTGSSSAPTHINMIQTHKAKHRR